MTDTICAISTASGVGAISIIRISGSEAIKVTNSIFKGPNLNECASHTVHYGFIISDLEIIDEVLVTVMRSPKTFTKEDVVEINCHGGIATTNKILEILLTNGCRQAEAGEFTKRAFLNGRIDLTEAEGIEDLIIAKTDSARKQAINQLKGSLSELIQNLRGLIIGLRANIEVNIDYPEYEDELEITHELLTTRLSEIKSKLATILTEAQNGRIIKEGINVALVGKPNVGKSSILNRLLEEEKAIVTDIAGTTRDIVEGTIQLSGVGINLVDTAGIRETKDIIEQIGVDKSLEQVEKSDLVIYVLSNSEPITKEDKEFIANISNKTHIIFINKDDLESKLDISKLNLNNIVYGNTKENDGVANLKAKIVELFNLETIATADFTYLTNARQVALVKAAIKYTEEAQNQTKNNVPVDIIAIDIENIWSTLGEIIGETYKDGLLDELFSKFCLGK